jgi:RNA polymerase sigma-70 factor (ECF subfamily)
VDDETRYRWIAAHVLPCEGEVRAWLRRNVRTLRPADVDDLIQEGYARLWQADFTRVTNARAYFHTTVRNVLLEHARRARIVPMERLGEIDALRIVSEEPGPERQVTARQELERLWRAIATLPRQCRLAFHLQNVEDRSRREIAAEMGISERTVEKHLAKALLRVAAAMEEDPVTPEGRSLESLRATEHDGK